MKRSLRFVLLSPSLLLTMSFVAGPVIMLARLCLFEASPGKGFYVPDTWTLGNLKELANGEFLRMTGFTVLFACIVAIFSVVIGYLIALAIRAVPTRRQPIILLLLFVPKTAGVVTTMFGLQRLLAETGLLNSALLGTGLLNSPLPLSRNAFGAILAESYLIIPVVTLILHLQLRRVDENLEFASKGLGADRWQSFCRVTLPLSLPGLRLSFQLSLMWGLTAFLGPMFLGGPDETTLAVEAYRQAFEYSRWPRAASLAMLSLLLISGVACWAAAPRWRTEGRR